MRVDYVPGDLGFDPLGLAPEDEDELNVMKTKELNHGRLAVSATCSMTGSCVVFRAKLRIRWWCA